MNPITRIDTWLLERTDQLVLWGWNTFHVPRIASIRVSMLGWLVINVIQLILSPGYLWLMIMIAIFVLGCLFVEEVREARLPPRLHNEQLLRGRGTLLTRLLRAYWVFIYPTVTLITLKSEPLDTLLLNVAQYVFIVAYLHLAYALVPTDPPKKKEDEVIDALPEGSS